MGVDKRQAMDSRVALADGSERLLSELWQDRPLVLVFLRHLGWTFCRQQVAQLRQKLPQLEQAGGRIVLVGMGTPEETAAFARKMELSVPMISDPDRRLYQSFGLMMATVPELFKPSVTFKAVAAMVQGHTVGLPVGDIRQLPGVFIIDRGGCIVFSHVGKNPADHPDGDTLVAALATIR